jgi:thioredoxin reductase
MINVDQREIVRLNHVDGVLNSIEFKDDSRAKLKAIYLKAPFEQNSPIPKQLGCEINEEGYIKTNEMKETTIAGVYACGDNAYHVRTVANAVFSGTLAGISSSKSLILEKYLN